MRRIPVDRMRREKMAGVNLPEGGGIVASVRLIEAHSAGVLRYWTANVRLGASGRRNMRFITRCSVF